MEIIHVVLGKANPNRMNGVNKVVYQLATEQAAHGMDVSVWGITKDMTKNYGDRNFKTRLFKKSRNLFNPGTDFKNAVLSKGGKAIFHIHGGWVPVFSSIAVLFAKNNIPFVFTPHGAYNEVAMKRNSFIKKIYFRLFEKKILEHTGKIHCIGQSEVTGLKNIFKTNKTFLLPYGFKLSAQDPFINDQKKELIIGFLGRLDIYTKGLDLLLDGFKGFTKTVPDAKLWFVGDGVERPKLEKMIANRGLTNSVTLFGGKFGSEKDELLKKMHAFAHPSRNEGLPSSVLEASNFGVPCIVSKATNVSEYVNNYKAGIEVENENAVDITNALMQIHELWKSGSLLTMKMNAQKMVKDEFSWEKLIYKFNKLYEQ
ncbi:MAG TPA: glycosyltransferase [Bacteroidia bacterium]|nr:glycosyltransferase [Bacteroidia bacterium]